MLRILSKQKQFVRLNRRGISYFNKSHDFISSEVELKPEYIDSINSITFGFTKYGIEQLGDIVYAESYKNINDSIETDESIGIVESVKASVDIIPSMSGVIENINNEFFNVIEENGGINLDDLIQMSSYENTNGIFLYKIKLDDSTKEETIQQISQTYMSINQYYDYLERMN